MTSQSGVHVGIPEPKLPGSFIKTARSRPITLEAFMSLNEALDAVESLYFAGAPALEAIEEVKAVYSQCPLCGCEKGFQDGDCPDCLCHGGI